MKVLVSVKRVVDPNVKVRVRPDGSDMDLTTAKMTMNPFDEIAVEEAVRLKEAGRVTEIVAVALGVSQCQDTLRHALAMGADRAILVETQGALESLTVAKLLHKIVQSERPGLILLGKQAIDDDAAQTGQMLAALLGCGQGTFASKVELYGETVRVTREIENGQEIVELTLPAVITADLRLNEPRYVKLPNLMQAKKKKIETLTPSALGVDPAPRVKLLRVANPPTRTPGPKLASVEDLITRVRRERRVLS